MSAAAQEADRISPAWVALGAAVFVALIAVGAIVARAATRGFARDDAPAPPAPTSSQIGIVEQTPAGEARRGLDRRDEQRRALERYGWVDRGRGVARIPIDRAMDLVADGGP
jgi:hypothetical protein